MWTALAAALVAAAAFTLWRPTTAPKATPDRLLPPPADLTPEAAAVAQWIADPDEGSHSPMCAVPLP